MFMKNLFLNSDISKGGKYRLARKQNKTKQKARIKFVYTGSLKNETGGGWLGL